MFIRSDQICILFTLLLAIHRVESQSCAIVNLEKIEDICTAQINCKNELDFDIKTWECIQETQQQRVNDYDRYHGYYTSWKTVTTYSDNYFIFINMEEPQQISSLLRNEEHVLKLTLKHGDLISIPDDVYKMVILRELNITGNNIATVNLNKFLSMSDLRKILLKNNMIQLIEVDNDSDVLFGRNNVVTIDMSSNLLEVLPNNFVSRFIKLQHLDLSHNLITSIGLLTFEGIVQLQTLDLSYNRLLGIGNALARFGSLIKLSVSHNNITKLNAYNFDTLSNLEKLNASSNVISEIENNTFHSLIKLKILDLRHNRLTTVKKQYFNKNVNLNTVLLSSNMIQCIEENSFDRTRITEFSIENNPLLGIVLKNTFKGINVTDLNLSGSNLTSIKDMAFADMLMLNNLNLSLNFISNLSYSAFSSLVSLNTLDLSHNKLKVFDVDSQNLQNLTKFYVHNNNIEKIVSNVFENFVSLTELDMSYNILREIEPHSFSKLNNVTKFTVKGSEFVSILKRKALEGLVCLQKLDMSETKTNRFENESFSGLTSLTDLNCASGQLAEIEYNAFLVTGQLQRLNFSNNQLHYFDVNATTIAQIQEIYLSNNFIANISSDTFSQLTMLRVLNMANNKILQLNSFVFQNSIALTYLDLSMNENMKVIGNPFQNLSKLYSLSLESIRKEISFENSTASIEVLNLQSCRILNINKLHIFNVQGLSYLNLSTNEITFINKDSFRYITTLISLDLSFNKISFIQPGSFLHVRRLTILNLYANDLATIQFGVFDGIDFLQELNISNNVLTNFDVKLLPNTSHLFLDDNLITNLSFETFLDTNLLILSVGGNQISCKVLAELKTSNYSDKFRRIVTAKDIKYHSENVNGISCQTTNFTSAETHTNNPTTILNISPLISTLKNVLEKLGLTLQAIDENTMATDDLKIKEGNVLESLQSLLESNKKRQLTNENYLTKLTEINNDSNKQLDDIKKYVMKIADNKNKKILEYESNTKSPIDEQNLRSEFQRMLKLENDALRQEFRNALASNSKVIPEQQSMVSNEKDFSNSKAAIYFMAVCLAIMVAVYVGNIVFKQIITSRLSHSSRSRTVISNSIEME